MAEFSRRGFLQTLAAVTGAALFDPVAKLWVPGAPKAIIVPTVTETITATQVIEEQAELNDLAMAFANRMSERLARGRRRIALSDVRFRQAGALAVGTLDVDGLGIGKFEPISGRMMPSGELGKGKANRQRFIDEMSGLLFSGICQHPNIDMFAPVGVELRAGVPFSPDVEIGTATDPHSGLSVRVLKFERCDGRGGGITNYGVEMVGGRWLVPIVKPRPERDDYGDVIDYNPEDDEYVTEYVDRRDAEDA